MHVSLCDQANPQWFGSDRLIFRNNCHTTTLHAPRSCQMELISLTTRQTTDIQSCVEDHHIQSCVDRCRNAADGTVSGQLEPHLRLGLGEE
jgi:hypothetical protein